MLVFDYKCGLWHRRTVPHPVSVLVFLDGYICTMHALVFLLQVLWRLRFACLFAALLVPSWNSVTVSGDMGFVPVGDSLSPIPQGSPGGKEDTLKKLYIGGIFPMTGGWAGGKGCRPAVTMALQAVNRRPDILPGYKLEMFYNDSQVRDVSCVEIAGSSCRHVASVLRWHQSRNQGHNLQSKEDFNLRSIALGLVCLQYEKCSRDQYLAAMQYNKRDTRLI